MSVDQRETKKEAAPTFVGAAQGWPRPVRQKLKVMRP